MLKASIHPSLIASRQSRQATNEGRIVF